jgi:hypothetical protein
VWRGNQAVGVNFIVNVEKRCVVRLKNPENDFSKVRCEDNKNGMAHLRMI